MQAATASNPRRHKPRRVIYKSTALERTAPHLVAAASTERVSAATSIQNANATAERVRLDYKQGAPADVNTVEGHDDVSNAMKYERRLKMNRQSAAASRVRREAYTKALEAELVKMENEYKSAVVKLHIALDRNRQLEKSHDDDHQPASVEHAAAAAAPRVKAEDEEVEHAQHPDASIPELADEIHVGKAPDQVPADDAELRALAELQPHDIDQFFTQAAQPKLEQLLADQSLIEHKHVLQFPIPDSLPDCFLHPPEHDLSGNEFL